MITHRWRSRRQRHSYYAFIPLFAGIALCPPPLESLSVCEPFEELCIQPSWGVDRNMVRESLRPNLLDPRQTRRANPAVAKEPNAEMVLPYDHATEVVPAHEVDARLYAIEA